MNCHSNKFSFDMTKKNPYESDFSASKASSKVHPMMEPPKMQSKNKLFKAQESKEKMIGGEQTGTGGGQQVDDDFFDPNATVQKAQFYKNFGEVDNT